MDREKQEGSPQVHPLEGKHIIYNYGEQDNEDEKWALVLFLLQNGKLKKVYSPSDRYEFGGIDREESNATLLALMREQGISEVYSVHHLKDFFGIPADWVSLSEEDRKEAENWFEYDSICTNTDETRLLEEAGVRLEHHFED